MSSTETDCVLKHEREKLQLDASNTGMIVTTADKAGAANLTYDSLPVPPDTQHIRVVDLLHSSDHNSIECRLQTHSLAAGVPFEALSYVWGDKGATRIVKCNSRNLTITQNLYDILNKLRTTNTSPPVRLWVDAICINQDNYEERSYQVAIMKQIYARAHGVLIWLGLDSEGDAHLAFHLATEIADSCCKVLHIDISDVARINVRQALDQVGAKVALNVSQDAAKWRAIEHLYQREWFKRIWVIQEAQSARPGKARAILGDLQIDFDVLSLAACWIDWCNVNNMQTGPLPGKMEHVNSAVIKRGPYLDSISFQTLLHQTREYKASNPRDKIYSMLGFHTAQKVSWRIRVDYTKSTAEVYQDVSRALLESGEGVDIVSFVRHGQRVSEGRPSWVCIFEYDQEFVLAWIPYFSAGGTTINRLPVVDNSGILSVECLKFDTVIATEKPLRLLSSPLLNYDDCQTLEAIIRRLVRRSQDGEQYPTRESLEVATSMTLTAGLRSANYRHLTPPQHLVDFQNFCRSTLRLQATHDPPEAQIKSTSPSEGDAIRYLNALRRVSHNRRFFETSQHYVGIGPQSMQVGDQVCILFGAKTPIVLQKVSGSNGLYHLLGDCYVHGIMFGEALVRKDIKAEMFRVL